MQSQLAPSVRHQVRRAVQSSARPRGNPPLDVAAVQRSLEALDRIVGR